MNDEDKVHDISKKIEREKALINAAQAMRQQTNNEQVRSKLDTQMREGRRNLEFFEEKLRELQMRRLGHGVDNMSLGASPMSGSHRQSVDDFEGHGAPTPPPKEGGRGHSSHQSQGSGPLMPASGPYPGGPPDSAVPRARPNYTRLGKLDMSPRSRYPSTDHGGTILQISSSSIPHILDLASS